jgi:hypothetical protein
MPANGQVSKPAMGGFISKEVDQKSKVNHYQNDVSERDCVRA